MRLKGSKNREFKGLQITYPASGFQNDTVRLLQKFVSTKSIRFEEFLTLWKASNFTMIYLGRTGIREKKELAEEAFAILLKYVMPPYNLQVRVGAVYALYCLYHTQRLDPKTRIRVPLSCWPNFCHLQQEVLEQQHLDAAYIIRQLIAGRAFMLCAYPSMLSVDEVYIHEDKERPFASCGAIADSTGLGESDGLLAQIQDEDSIGQLHAVHEKYHELKCRLNTSCETNADHPSDSINLIKPGIAETILKIVSRSELLQTDNSTGMKESAGINESTERAKKLKAIKAAASTSKAGATSRLSRARMKDPDQQAISDHDETVGKSSYVVKRKGRPRPKRPKVQLSPESTSSSSEEESSLNNTDSLKPRYQTRAKRTKRKADVSDDTDEDYVPCDDLESTLEPRKKPKRCRVASKSLKEKEKTGHIARKALRSSTGNTTAKKIFPGKFVALCPDERNPNQPVIGKVIAVKSQDEIEVALYKGSINSAWTPVTAVSKEDNVEGKPLVETINSSEVIMTGLILTKRKQLPERMKSYLRKAMENALSKE